MAFLCPSRRSRQKKKKEQPVKEPFLGRITGSASVDTLVRVGLEKQHGLSPESRMTVVDDFSACVDDELSVSQGQLVYMLYTEQEWMYVIADDGKEGFIPRSFAKPLRSPAFHRRPPPTPQSQVGAKSGHGLLLNMTSTDDEGNEGDQSNSPTNSSSQAGGFPEDDRHQTSADRDADDEDDLALGLPDIQPFEKRDQGKWVALFSFEGIQEDDVRLSVGEVVVVLNKEDADWLWVKRSGGEEGFVPRAFVCSLPDDLRISGKRDPQQRPIQGHARTKSLSDQPLHLTRQSHPFGHRPLSSGPLLFPSHSHPPQSRGQRSQHSPLGVVPPAPPPYPGNNHPHSSTNSGSAACTSNTNLDAAGQKPPPYRPIQRPHSSTGNLLSNMPASPNTNKTSQNVPHYRPQSSTGDLLNNSDGMNRHPPNAQPRRPHSSMGNPFPGSNASASDNFQYNRIRRTSESEGTQRMSTLDPPSLNGGGGWKGDDPKFPPSGGNLVGGSRGSNLIGGSRGDNQNGSNLLRGDNQNFKSIAENQNGRARGDKLYDTSRANNPSTSNSLLQTFPPSSSHFAPISYNGVSSLSTASKTPSTSSVSSTGYQRSLSESRAISDSKTDVRTISEANSWQVVSDSKAGSQAISDSKSSHAHVQSYPHVPSQSVRHVSTGDHVATKLKFQSSVGLTHSAPPHPPVNRLEGAVRPNGLMNGRPRPPSSTNIQGQHDVRELITLHRFTSKAADDISVSSGEIVYSDLANQPEKDWLWVFSPKLEKHGYIPRNNVKIPGNADECRSGGVARV